MAGYTGYDYVNVVSGGTSDTYTFYKGTSSGSLVGTTILVYTDSSKAILSKVFMQ
jgi:hypothetical protein